MTNHWLIAALGAGTVFLALIALSLIVSLFPVFFRKPQKKRVAQAAPLPELVEPAARPTPAAPTAPAAPAGAVSSELVAVIAAAVAAASGMGPGQFRIASVSAEGSGGQFNTPVWGHVDRLVRTFQNRN